MMKYIGKTILSFCNKTNTNTDTDIEIYNNYEQINLNIHKYISKLYIDNNIYNYFKNMNLIKKNIYNYNIKLKIINGIIINYQLKIKYEFNYILLKYAILPINFFDNDTFIKIENYNLNNNKINELTIYNFNNYIIYIILEYIIRINKKLLFNNYNIEIYDNKINFNLI